MTPSYELKKVNNNWGGGGGGGVSYRQIWWGQNPQNSKKQGGHGKPCFQQYFCGQYTYPCFPRNSFNPFPNDKF